MAMPRDARKRVKRPIWVIPPSARLNPGLSRTGH